MGKENPRFRRELGDIASHDRDALQREQQMAIRRAQYQNYHRKRKAKRARSKRKGSYDD